MPGIGGSLEYSWEYQHFRIGSGKNKAGLPKTRELPGLKALSIGKGARGPLAAKNLRAKALARPGHWEYSLCARKNPTPVADFSGPRGPPVFLLFPAGNRSRRACLPVCEPPICVSFPPGNPPHWVSGGLVCALARYSILGVLLCSCILLFSAVGRGSNHKTGGAFLLP